MTTSPPPETPPEEPPQKRPYGILREMLSILLLGWGISIVLFIIAEFDPNPLFGWKFATAWIGGSVIGWVLIFRVLQRLRKLPPQ